MKTVGWLIVTIVLGWICFISVRALKELAPGGHGSIKAYIYPVTKIELEKAVKIVLSTNDNVKRDSVDNVIYDVTNPEKVDTLHDNLYNDGKQYFTIYITSENNTFQYTFQFTGNEADWDTSKSSEISIAYAWDDKAKGGSEGHGDFGGKWGLKKKLTAAFEKEVIDKIDRLLGKSHTESK